MPRDKWRSESGKIAGRSQLTEQARHNWNEPTVFVIVPKNAKVIKRSRDGNEITVITSQLRKSCDWWESKHYYYMNVAPDVICIQKNIALKTPFIVYSGSKIVWFDSMTPGECPANIYVKDVEIAYTDNKRTLLLLQDSSGREFVVDSCDAVS